MKREPLSRGEKVLAVVSVVVVASILGGMTWMQRIDEEPPIVFPPVVPVPSPNGFDAYVAARKSITMWKPAVDEGSETESFVEPKIAAQRYGLARRNAWLRANASGFSLFKKAQALPCQHPAVRPHKSMLSAWPAYASVREMARFKAAETNTFKLRGDWSGAAQSGLDTIQMSIDMQRGGALMAKLVGSASAALGQASLEDVPEHLDAAAAKAAARRLERLIARRVSMADAMEESKWQSLDEFLTYARRGDWRQLDPTAGFTLKRWIQCRVASKRQIIEKIQKYGDDAIADAKKPYSAPVVEEPSSENDPFATWYAGLSYGRSRFNTTRDKTSHDLLLLRFALRAYTLEHGAAPAKLEQLIPGYLKAVPRDTFAADAPLHYVPSGKTYRLWSVGPDRKDNGGTPAPWRNPTTSHAPRRLPPVMADSIGDWVAGKNK